MLLTDKTRWFKPWLYCEININKMISDKLHASLSHLNTHVRTHRANPVWWTLSMMVQWLDSLTTLQVVPTCLSTYMSYGLVRRIGIRVWECWTGVKLGSNPVCAIWMSKPHDMKQLRLKGDMMPKLPFFSLRLASRNVTHIIQLFNFRRTYLSSHL